jgi:hypothetical protein
MLCRFVDDLTWYEDPSSEMVIDNLSAERSNLSSLIFQLVRVSLDQRFFDLSSRK